MAATIKSKMQKMLEEEAARRGVKKSTQSEKEEPVTKRKTTSTSTKAGTTAPAFGVLTNVSDRTGFAEYNKAKSFAEYSAMRKKQEEAEGMRRAADQLGQMYGYKNVAGKAVYATPFSPLPNPAGGRGATKAQAPGAYGIAPGTYVQSMKDVAAYMNMKQPSYDNETQAFLDKYFGGNIPTAEQFDETYQRLYSDFSVPDEDVSYFFHKGAELVGKATNEQEKYKQELTEAQAGYDAAVKLLGENAEKYLGSEAEYFERYGNTYGAGNTAQEYADYVQTPKRGIGNAFEKLFGGNDRSDLYTFNVLNEGAYTNISDDTIVTGSMLAAQNMTPNQRKTYLALAGEYGESAAEAYYEALLRDDGFNKQAYEMRNEALRDAARENWFGATAKTFLTAPAQIAGSLYAIKQGLTGQEIDPYNTAFAPAQATQTPREQVLQDKTKEYGRIDEETGKVNDTLRSVLFRGAYSAGTSFADSMIANMLGGGIPAASSLLQGGMQMGGDVQDVKLRGGTDAQALALGGISALIEAGTEYIPADNLIKAIQGSDIKTIKELGWNVAKSILGEAPGEGLSELGSAAADRVIMGELSEWQQTVEAEGTWAAAKNLIKNVGEAMLAGAISGGAEGAIGGTAGYIRTRNVQKELEAAAQQYDADQKVKEQEAEAVTPHPSAAQTPSHQGEGKTPDVRDALLREYTPETAQVERQQAEEPVVEEESAQEEMPAETASEGEKEQRFTQARGATVRDEDGVESRVRVVGVKMNEGTPLMVTETDDGETDYATADELTFDDEMGELLGYEGVANMDAKGLRSYLEGWDGETAAEDYARAYAAVYQRASAGLDYEQAAMQNEAARRYLTEDARMSAYAAGQNAYNQTHNTVKAAEIVNETAETGDSKASNYSIREEKIQTNRHAPETHRPRYGKATLDSESNLDFSATKNPDNRIGVEQQENAAAPSSAQDAAGVYGLSSQGRNAISSNGKSSIAQSDTNGKLSKRYKTKKWNTLTLKQKNNAVAQMEVMAAFASRTGHTIVVVDSITGSDGQKANATYNPDTHEITVALDATEGAYAYAAMHELTHAMRNEHADEWDSFVDFVRDGLKANGQNWDELVAYQMDRFGYDEATAEEEVICNTVPALLQDERNVLKLYKGNRTLFERVVDWVKGLLKDVKAAGEKLSTRSQSWAQMDALKNDRELLQGMYDRLMAVMEKPAEASNGETRVVKLSAKESSYDPENAAIKDQIANSRELLNSMNVVASVTVPENMRSKKAAQEWAIELLKSTGYRVDRQYFGVITFDENDIRYAMNYANTEAEKAAIAALPKVLKRGIEIGRHNDHKKRAKQTVTIAAPVELNGIRGNMAVVVNLNGNHYYTHRIVLPDGSVFKFNAQQKEAVRELHRGVTVSSSLADATSTASNNSIAENGENVKFSLRDTDENVQDAMTAQQKAFQQVRSHRITASEADKLAGVVLKESNSTYDRQKLASEISQIFDYIERGEDINWNQVDDELSALSARVMEKSRTLDLEHEEMAKPIRDYLRKTGIRLTESQRREAESLTGSYGAYRKALFGRVRLSSTSGTPLDSLWGELNGMNAELFPADVAEGEMPSLLMTAVDALKPVYHTGKGMNVEESASWLAGKLNEAYFSLPAVKAAAQDARTFGDSIRDLKAAMKRFEETSWTEYQSALRSIKEARTAEKRTQKQEETAALRAKYQNWRDRDTAARKEREMKAKYRARIERTTKAMSNWVLNPTDAKHVPSNVEDSVKAMLVALDFSGKDTKVAATLTERLNRLATEMERAQKGENENENAMYLELDQQMIDEIRQVAELIRSNTEHQQMEGRGVYDLNGMELRELSKWLDVVRHVVTEAGKLRGSNLPGNSVAEVQQMSYMELRQKKPYKDKKWITKELEKYFGTDMLDSFTFFERLGPTANAVFMELRGGFDQMAGHLREAEAFSKTLFEDLKLKELTGKTAAKHKVELQNGNTLEMTKGQMMAIYVLSRREQARGHMYEERHGEGIILFGDEDPDPNQLTAADEKKIDSLLTDDEKRVAEGMQGFLSRECANWGNATSMKLLGYRKFGEEYYWPIRTDGRTRNTAKLEDTYEANIYAIMTQSHTKALVKGAKNAIVIEDIFDSYTKHISNMAAYSAYAMPLSDFNKWYNNTDIKRSIAKTIGPKGEDYIKNLLMAINGSSRPQSKTGVEKLVSGMNRNAKTASVGANARVIIQQPTSFARAAMYMSPKYLSAALVHKEPKAELINRYCGIAWWKNAGFYETNVGPNMKEMLTGNMTGMAWLRDKAMIPAAAGDQWTMNRLWVACELETQEVYPELVKGTEEYYQQVGKRMGEIVDRTQVVDSVFHRSQMMRSKSWLAQTLTNFSAEPFKTANMLMGVIYDLADNRNNKAAQKRVARAFGVWITTGVLTAAAAAVIDAFRDDEDEKKWIEKYLGALGENTVDNLNPLGMLPLVKDVLSIVQGYSNSDMSFQSVQKLVWAYQATEKYMAGEGTQNWYGIVYKWAQAASSLTGVPVSNLMRDFNGVWQTVNGTSLTLKESARKSQRITLLYDAMLGGKKKDVQEQRSILKTKVGLSDKEIDTALAERLIDDSLVKEAWDAKSERDYPNMNRTKNKLTALGFTGEMVDKAILRYGKSVTEEEEEEKDLDEQLNVALYSNDEVVKAMKTLAGLENGGSVTEADIRTMISDRQAASKAKDPEASVKSDIQSELKKEYIAMETKGNTAGMRKLGSVLKNVLGTDDADMEKWVRDAHGDQLREAIDNNNATAAAKMVNKMRTADKKSDSDINSSLSKYKSQYIQAMKKGDKLTANKIKRLLQGLGLRGKNGKDLYADSVFEDWLKEK